MSRKFSQAQLGSASLGDPAPLLYVPSWVKLEFATWI